MPHSFINQTILTLNEIQQELESLFSILKNSTQDEEKFKEISSKIAALKVKYRERIKLFVDIAAELTNKNNNDNANSGPEESIQLTNIHTAYRLIFTLREIFHNTKLFIRDKPYYPLHWRA